MGAKTKGMLRNAYVCCIVNFYKNTLSLFSSLLQVSALFSSTLVAVLFIVSTHFLNH
jgi:hypothetical protein